jgi:hypothetical protein
MTRSHQSAAGVQATSAAPARATRRAAWEQMRPRVIKRALLRLLIIDAGHFHRHRDLLVQRSSA